MRQGPYAYLLGKELLYAIRRTFLHAWYDVGVSVERHRDGGVPESLLNHLRVLTGGKKQCRVRMSQVVDAHIREPESAEQRFEVASRDVLQAKGSTILGCEHEVLIAICGTKRQSVSHLPHPMTREDSEDSIP
jgi:hypothetical protein